VDIIAAEAIQEHWARCDWPGTLAAGCDIIAAARLC